MHRKPLLRNHVQHQKCQVHAAEEGEKLDQLFGFRAHADLVEAAFDNGVTPVVAEVTQARDRAESASP